MELRHLKHTLAAADHGSFRCAARILGVQESTLSRCIRDLEDELGVSLFIRYRSGARLTHAGEEFVCRIRVALGQIGYAVEGAGAMGRGETGTIRVGIYSSLASGFLADLFRAHRAAEPEVRVDIIDSVSASHVAAVRRHQIDVVFIAAQQAFPECDVEKLWSEDVFVVLPRNHHLVSYKSISWTELRGQTFIVSEAEPGPEIHRYLVRHLSELGHHPIVERQAVCRDTLLQLVSHGRGLTLTSEATTGISIAGIVYRPLSADQLPFSAVWSPRNDNPALRRFLRLARELKRERRSTSPYNFSHGKA